MRWFSHVSHTLHAEPLRPHPRRTDFAVRYAIELPPGSGAYNRGWYDTRYGKLYVSRGIGVSAVPMRIGAAPELAVFEFGGRDDYEQTMLSSFPHTYSYPATLILGIEDRNPPHGVGSTDSLSLIP